MRRRELQALLLSALVLAPTAARAEPASSVILLRAAEHRWRAAEDRTCDELRVMGLRVEVLPDRPEPSQLMAERGALAAIRLQRRGDVAEAQVWLADPAGGEPRSQRIDTPALDGAEIATLTALRAAELVHTAVAAGAARPTPPARDALTSTSDDTPSIAAGAPPSLPSDNAPSIAPGAKPRFASDDTPSIVPGIAPSITSKTTPSIPYIATSPALLVPLGPPSAPSGPASSVASDAPADDPLERAFAELRPAPPPASPPLRRALGGYATLGGGPGGAGLLVGGALALRWELGRAIAVRAELLAATSAAAIDVGAGSLRVGLAGPRAALVIEPWRRARVSPRLGLGGGVALGWATGRAASPLRGGRDLTVVGLLGGSLGGALRLRPGLHLYLGVDLSFMVPGVALRVTGEEVARLGMPLVLGVLGLEWGWSARRRR